MTKVLGVFSAHFCTQEMPKKLWPIFQWAILTDSAVPNTYFCHRIATAADHTHMTSLYCYDVAATLWWEISAVSWRYAISHGYHFQKIVYPYLK